jgi:hypothetical protein
MNKRKFIKHTNINDININNIALMSNEVIYNHPEYGFKHQFIIPISIGIINKYPFTIHDNLNPNDKIDMRINYESRLLEKSKFWSLIKMIQKKYTGKIEYYPKIDSNQNTIIKLSHIQKLNFNIYEFTTDTTYYKHQIESIDDIKSIIKSGYQILPIVRVHMFIIDNNGYTVFKPERIYIGKTINEKQKNLVLNYEYKKKETPISNYFDPTPKSNYVSSLN